MRAEEESGGGVDEDDSSPEFEGKEFLCVDDDVNEFGMRVVGILL